MPAPGEFVTYYNHESWDNTHRVVDWPAIVLAELPDGVLRLKVFEWGKPPYDAEVGPFPDEAPKDANGNLISGGNYWREGDEAPDFDSAYAENSPEARAEAARDAAYNREVDDLKARQAKELENIPNNPDALRAKHERELRELDARYEASDEPLDPRAAGQPTKTPAGGVSINPARGAPPTVTNSLPKVD